MGQSNGDWCDTRAHRDTCQDYGRRICSLPLWRVPRTDRPIVLAPTLTPTSHHLFRVEGL